MKTTTALIDSGTSFILMPLDDHSKIVESLNKINGINFHAMSSEAGSEGIYQSYC